MHKIPNIGFSLLEISRQPEAADVDGPLKRDENRTKQKKQKLPQGAKHQKKKKKKTKPDMS